MNVAHTADPILAQLRCQFPLRLYQSRAIETAERRLAQGDRRLHLVAPPGSGKTILGLELVRRLGRPALVLSPNAAIQRQWADKVRFFLPPESALAAADVVAEQCPPCFHPIISLTYQSLAVASRDGAPAQRDGLLLDDLAHALWASEAGDAGRIAVLRQANPEAYRQELRHFRARVRARLLDDPTFDPTTLLHPSARALMDALVARETRTVVLDECHHLTGTWAILLGALLRRLPEAVIIGLTATPPVDRSNRELVRYLDLVGEIDFQLPTPAVVRDGNLAPYQDLVYLTVPTRDEMRFVASEHAHWSQLQAELNAGGAFSAWIEERVRAPRSDGGRSMAWDNFLKSRHSLAVAAVRWLLSEGKALPEHVQLTPEMVAPVTLEDRLRLIADYALRYLKLSPNTADRELYTRIKAAGQTLGYLLTESGFRRSVAPVDRLLSLSRAKHEAALEILRHEWQALGERLRAVVITDFERSSATVLRQLAGVLDPEAESALGVMRLLATSDLERDLRPVLVTGQTLLCEDTVVEHFLEAGRRWLAARGLDATVLDEAVPGEGFHRIAGAGRDWRTGTYVAMVTALLEQGVTRCLVGTRALLGEGWDSLSLNTFIDLTYATTFTAVNQLRGRAIRLDPSWPDKVADNWDVVCIAPGYEKGMRDFERFVRKHEAFFGISDDGIIEAGVGHVHPLLHELSGAELAAERERINAEMLDRPYRRAQARALWQIGAPYEDREVAALDFRALPRPTVVSRVGATRREEALRAAGSLVALGGVALAVLALTPVVTSLALGLMQALGEALLSGGYELGRLRLGVGLTWLLLSLGTVARSALLLLRGLGQRFGAADEEATVLAMATATLEALRTIGQLSPGVSAAAIRVSRREDGFVRVWIETESGADAECFARALSELLGPVTSDFRYMIPRSEMILGGSTWQRFWKLLRWITNRWVPDEVVWHPVPHDLGVRAETVSVFEDAWQRHVSPGEALFLRRPEATAPLRQAQKQASRVERRSKRIWR